MSYPTAKFSSSISLAFLLTALTAELLDEVVDGAGGAAWPAVQRDLALSYAQVGLLLGLPTVLGSLLDPFLGLLADAGWRRRLILGGGLGFGAALALHAAAGGFWTLLAALLLFYVASGAFVNLLQAALMDADPARREQNMARWALAGSVGNVAGPLLVGLAISVGAGWRPVYALLAALALAAVGVMWRSRASLEGGGATQSNDPESTLPTSWRDGLGAAASALRRGEVRRTLLLLECANLTLDVLRGFLALYFVGAAGASPAAAALAVAVFTGVGLLGDVLVLPVLECVPGVRYVWFSASLTALLFPAFLLAPQFGVKLVLVGLLGLLNAGWYAVLQARLYDQLPERSGTVVALGSVAGVVAGVVPLLLGLVAQHFGVQSALWLLLAGPLALLVGLWRADREGSAGPPP